MTGRKTIDTYYDHHPTTSEIQACVTEAAERGLVTRFRAVLNHDDDDQPIEDRQFPWVVRVDYSPKGDQR